MINAKHLTWTRIQQTAFVLTIFSGAVLGVVAAPFFIETQHVCADEVSLRDWLLCEFREIWPQS